MFTFIGVVLIIIAIIFLLVGTFVPYQITQKIKVPKPGGGYGEYTVEEQTKLTGKPKWLTGWKKPLLITILGILIIGINGLFFINPPGTATSIQYLWGGDDAATTQGLKLKYYGRTIPISFEIAMQDVIGDVEEEEGIYYRNAQRREFADAIKADIASSLIVSVDYFNEENFLSMADKNRSEEKLVYARIYPVYDQALKNTCKLMDAQDYISGAASQFDYYLKDQMENGMYLTEEIFVDVNEMDITTGDSTRTVAKGGIDKNKREKKYRIKIDADGEIVRDASNSLKRYGLTVQQAAVTNIDWEQSFDDRLQDQKEQVALTQLEKQEAEKEYYATQKAIAQGEREKAEVRVIYEKKQLEQTIAAETNAKKAKYKEEEEKNLYNAAKLEAKKIKTLADADYYRNQKLVAAGLTPQERKEMDVQKNKDAWDNIGKLTLPNQMFIMGSKGSGKEVSVLEAILSAELMKTGTFKPSK